MSTQAGRKRVIGRRPLLRAAALAGGAGLMTVRLRDLEGAVVYQVDLEPAA